MRRTGNKTDMNRAIFAFSILFGLCCVTANLARAERTLSWPDLLKKIEIEDPLEGLSPKQIADFSVYARIQELRKNSPKRVTEAMRQEAERAAASLRKEGIDLKGLLLKWDEVKRLRTQQAHNVVEELNGQQVRIAGYALPLEFTGRKVTEFLLVPWVGACIHTPPPPPNQIVYVILKKGFETKDNFEPVWVTGQMTVKSSSKNLFLVDGAADIDVGYTLNAKQVQPYKK